MTPIRGRRAKLNNVGLRCGIFKRCRENNREEGIQNG